MRRKPSKNAAAIRAEQFEKVLPGVMAHFRRLLHRFFVDGVCPVLEGLFPFSAIRKVILFDKLLPNAVAIDKRRGVRIDIPFKTGLEGHLLDSGDSRQGLSIELSSNKAHFQRIGDRSKGHILNLAGMAASTITADAEAILRSTSPDRLLPQLASGLPTAIVAEYLQSSFSLNFDIRRFLAILFEISSRSYEARPTSQGFLVTDGATNRTQSVLSLLERNAKHLLPSSDGYHTALAMNRDGRCVGLVDLKEECQRKAFSIQSKGDHPEWLERIARLTRRKRLAKGRKGTAIYDCGIVLTQHGDILVIARGILLLAYRAGVWRVYDHEYFRDEISRALRAVGRPRDTLESVANAIYQTAIDASFRHTGGLIGVFKRRSKNLDFIDEGDCLGEEASGLRGVIDRQGFQAIDRAVRTGLSAIDGALVLDHKHTLIALGAVIKGRNDAGSDAPVGARTRAAKRLSEAGMAVKVSADGDVELYEGGELTRRLL